MPSAARPRSWWWWSPVSFPTQASDGTNLYGVDDMPEIDALLITHDHWDHLDHATVTALKDKVDQVLLPLGVGAHLEHWGYASEKVREADWYEKLQLDGSLTIRRETIEGLTGRPYDLQAIHVNLVTLSGYIDEDDDQLTLSWAQ